MSDDVMEVNKENDSQFGEDELELYLELILQREGGQRMDLYMRKTRFDGRPDKLELLNKFDLLELDVKVFFNIKSHLFRVDCSTLGICFPSEMWRPPAF